MGQELKLTNSIFCVLTQKDSSGASLIADIKAECRIEKLLIVSNISADLAADISIKISSTENVIQRIAIPADAGSDETVDPVEVISLLKCASEDNAGNKFINLPDDASMYITIIGTETYDFEITVMGAKYD